MSKEEKTSGVAALEMSTERGQFDGTDLAKAPLVLLARKLSIQGKSTERILDRLGYRVCVGQGSAVLRQQPQDISPRPHLLISPLHVEGVALTEFALRARKTLSALAFPILAVAEHRGLAEDLGMMRDAGISGLVNTDHGIDHFCMRVDVILRPLESRHSELRVPCFLPAELCSGSATSPTIIISLSPGGIRAAVNEAYKINDELTVRLRLPGSESNLEIPGRVTFVAPPRDDLHRQEVGIAFVGCPSSVTEKLTEAVMEILRGLENR